jgi:hypothetical protein
MDEPRLEARQGLPRWGLLVKIQLRNLNRSVIALGAIAATGGVVALSGLALSNSNDQASKSGDPIPASTSDPANPSASPLPGTAPAGPISKTCDTAGMAGPAKAPAGAVVVSPSQHLGDVVEDRGERSTYWLAPGTHAISRGAYDQVIPHAGDTFIGAPGAVLDGKNRARYAFTGSAAGVTVSHLVVQNFGSVGGNNNEGVVNHDSAPDWTVSSSTVQKNAGAGIMVGSGNKLIGNCLRNNGQYAFNAYHADGVSNVLLKGNEISGNNTDDWEERQPGCGCTGGGKFWATNGAKVIDNYVHNNRGVGLWADTNNANFLFQGNYISGNDAEGLMYETSYNAAILNNTFVRNAIGKGPTNPQFPASAIYLSESGSDKRVAGPYGSVLRVADNVFLDNWSGIVLWENADRFAGSPANTSSGTTTLVAPNVATETACQKPANIAKPPFNDDCRWKTQNVLVERNTFALDPAKVAKCAPNEGCGFNGVFSNYGTFPEWSPFKAYVVAEDITFKQNNVWRDNTYRGPWSFMARTAGEVVSWEAWQAAPYQQDAGSTLKK